MKRQARTAFTTMAAGLLALQICSSTHGAILSVSDVENVCGHAAADAKEFLRVAEEGGKEYRGKETVLVLGIQNFSKKWQFSGSLGQDLPLKLARALAAPGRIRTEIFSVCTARPGSETWKRFADMLASPGKAWPDDMIRAETGVRWLVYGYLLDVPGHEKPYAILKMTDTKDRLLVWGGCFSLDAKVRGHRKRALYPSSTEIAGAMEVPSWMKPEEGSSLLGTCWFPAPQGASREPDQEAEPREEDIFADLLAIALVRLRRDAGKVRWFDPAVVRAVVGTASADAEGETKPVVGYGLLSEIRGKPGWQELDTFITGTVGLKRPRLGGSVLKLIGIEAPDASEGPVSTYVVSGYCSKEGGHSGRRDWVRRTIGPGLRRYQPERRTMSVAAMGNSPASAQFRDTISVAIAQPEVPGCRVLDSHSPNATSAAYEVLTFTDLDGASDSLFMFISETKTGSIIWGRKHYRPGARVERSTYFEYCIKLLMSMRAGAAGYGRLPAIVWVLGQSAGPGGQKVGAWSSELMGLELVATLVDPSRPFVRAVAGKPFGAGSYAELIKAVGELGGGSEKSLRAITFQLLSRGDDQRPALVAKYLDPATGAIHWAFYDEPSGTPLVDQEEDYALQKIQDCVSRLSVGQTGADRPLAALVGGIEDHGLLSAEQRTYEMLVTELAARRERPPVEWEYLLARNAAAAGSGVGFAFDEGTHAQLTKLGVTSVVQAECLLSPLDSERDAEPGALQFFAWESSPYELAVEEYAASPRPAALLGQRRAGLPGLQFLHHLTSVLMNGAKNSQTWESLGDLQHSDALIHKILTIALQDYASDPGLTQNVVIERGSSRRQVVSRGTDSSTVSAGRGFLGFLHDPVLARVDRGTLLIGVKDLQVHAATRPSTSSRRAGTQVSRLYPPDWRANYPDGRPLLDMPGPMAEALIRRSCEHLVEQAGYNLLNMAGLQQRYTPQGDAEEGEEAPEEKNLIEAFAKETELQTAQLALVLSGVRAFVVEDASGKPYLVHTVVVRPLGETVYPKSQIFGSLPDSFRYFLVQEPPATEGKPSPFQQVFSSGLAAAAKADLERVSSLWDSGKQGEARKLRGEVMRDLALWARDFAATRDTVTSASRALVEDATKTELEAIRQGRMKVASAGDRRELKSIRAQEASLLKMVGGWEESHESLGGLAAGLAVTLARTAVTAHTANIAGALELAQKTASVSSQTDAKAQLDTARFLSSELMEDLGNWAELNPEVEKAIGAEVQALARRYAQTHKAMANALYPQLLDLKRKEKDAKEAGLAFLKRSVDGCLEDLSDWSKTLKGLSRVLKEEKARTPGWSRKAWRKSTPVPAKTLRDATTALAEELD